MITAQQLSDQLGGKKSGKGWMAKCPAHDDGKASLSINETPDGVVLLKCHAGCETQAVLEKLSLTFADLQPEREEKARIVAVYDYRDEKQQLRYQALRMQPKDFRVRRPDGAGGHIWNIGGVEGLPYRLPQITQAIGLRQPVFIVEGEKDADSLSLVGLEATTNHGGAGKWQPTLNRWFKDADVVLLPDNDEPGRKHTKEIAASLYGIARRIRILELPGLPPKGDVSDWLQAGGTAEALLELANTAPEYTPASDAANPLMQYLIHARDLKKLPPMKWLIPGEIPDQGLVVVYGPSGIGKSFFVLDYALRLAQTERVLYVASEGELGFIGRVEAWTKHHNLNDEGECFFLMHVAALLDKDERPHVHGVVQYVRPRLIVIDTLAHSLLPGNENDTRDMGMFLRQAKILQRQYNCAVMLVHHTGKMTDVERGSSTLRAAADIMIKLTDMDTAIRVECTKSKDTEPFPTRHIALLPVQLTSGGKNVVAVKSDLVEQRKGDPLTARQESVLRAYALDVFCQGASLADIAEVTGIIRGYVANVASRLAVLGYLDKTPNNSYRISDEGWSYLGLTPVTRPDSSRVTRAKVPAHAGDSSDSSDSRDSAHMKNPKNGALESLESLESVESPPSLPETRSNGNRTGRTGRFISLFGKPRQDVPDEF